MPVLIEGATWVARASVLEARHRGGVAAFAARVPPGACSADGELVAISFADRWTARARMDALAVSGLELFRERAAGDVALLDHRHRPDDWCPWLELAVVPLGPGERVLAARAAGSARVDVAVPPGWRFEGSATERDGLVELPPADRPLRFVRREAGVAVYVDRFAGGEVRVHVPDPAARIAVETAAGARHEVRVEVVRRRRAIELGLMHRDRLDEDAGMLFLFGDEAPRTFWMKNTLVPLDMLFVDAAGVIVNVVERAAPMSLAPCPSRRPCSVVLEVNGGWARARGVRAGDRVVRGAETEGVSSWA